MNGAKPWQIAVVIIGLLGGTGLLAWNFLGSSSKKTADSMSFIDVVDGTLFKADLRAKKGMIVPAKNPDTGEYTLVPVEKSGSDWVVPDYFRRVLKEVPISATVVDLASGKVQPASENQRPYRRN